MKPGYQYRVTVVVCGYRYEISGKPVQSIFVIYPSGTIESAGAWDESDPWFYAPSIHEEEKLRTDGDN